MPTYAIEILHPPTAASGTRLTVAATVDDSEIGSLMWAMNGHDQGSFTIPVASTSLDDLVLLDTEIAVTRNGTRIWWGVPTDLSQRQAVTSVRAMGLTSYLAKRFIGKQRTNLISNGNMSGTAGTVPASWTDSDAGADTTVALRTAGASGVPASITDETTVLEIRQNVASRAVDTRNDGVAIASPTDPDDYHGADAQVQQTWTNSASVAHVYVCKAWVFIRDDATYAYGGKAFDTRGFYIQEQTGAGAYTGTQWFVPIDDSTARDEWVRMETTVVIGPGNKGQIRLYSPAATAALESAVYWTGVGVYQEESLAFYTGDGVYVTSIIEGIVEHVNGGTVNSYTSDHQDLLIDADPANSSSSPNLTYQIAYQAADHHNAWEEIKNFVNMRSTQTGSAVDGPVVSATWTTSPSTDARYISSKAAPTTTKTAFPMIINGSSATVIDAALSVQGGGVVNRVTALGLGDGPDREEASTFDRSNISVDYEGIVNTGHTGVALRYLDDYARAEVAYKSQIVSSLRVTIAASTESALNENGDYWTSDPVDGLGVGDVVGVTGDWGKMQLSGTQYRIVRKQLSPMTETMVLELNEVI